MRTNAWNTSGTLGDHLAQAREGLGAPTSGRPAPPAARRPERSGARRPGPPEPSRGRGVEDVLLADPATHARAGQAGEVHAVLGGQLADQGGHVGGLVVVAAGRSRGAPLRGGAGFSGAAACGAGRGWAWAARPARSGCFGAGSLGRGLLGRAARPGPARPAAPAAGGRLARADDGELGTDLDGLVLRDLDLEQRARDRGGDLGVDLVGGDLEQRLVDGDGVADLLEPAGHGALGDRLAQRGQRHRGAVPAPGRHRGRCSWAVAAGPARARLLAAGWARAPLLGAARRARPRGRLPPSLAGADSLGLGPEPSHLPRPITASTAPTSTVSSSAALISSSVPATGRGDLGVDLVGGDLEQRLVDRDRRRRPA